MKRRAPAWPVGSAVAVPSACPCSLAHFLQRGRGQGRCQSWRAPGLCRHCLRCSSHCLPVLLCFLPSLFLLRSAEGLQLLLMVPNVLIIPYWRGKAPFIPVFWCFNLFATFPFLSPFPLSLSLSYLACFLPSGLICPLISFIFIFYNLRRRIEFLFSALIAFV